MTNQNYSISDARDLVCDMKNALVFLNTGVPEQYLDPSVTQAIMSFLQDSTLRLDGILEKCVTAKSQ